MNKTCALCGCLDEKDSPTCFFCGEATWIEQRAAMLPELQLEVVPLDQPKKRSRK